MKKTIEKSIGGTPLIYLKKLSEITQCEIYGKAEFLNPGGSIKDRTALGIIKEGFKTGKIKEGYTVYEGTAGNTGIGLAMLASQFNYKCKIVMPNNQAQEKYQTLQALGADVQLVPPCPFSNPAHFYHTAKVQASEDPKGYWCDQFENLANFRIHKATTGPEIWSQMDQNINIYCSSAGTGGSIAGITSFLKFQDSNIKTYLIDPMGSGLYSYLRFGEVRAEGSSVSEGIGIMRITSNYKQAQIDDGVQVSDSEMISMLHYLAKYEGLLVGSSSALNVLGAYKIAKMSSIKNLRIVTLLCDTAARYQSKIFNSEWLESQNLKPEPDSIPDMFN